RFKIDKLVNDTGQQEIQGTQPKNSANVGGVDDERVACNAKDRRDRVDGEENVRDLDNNQHKSQRRQHPPAFEKHGEGRAEVAIAHGQQPAHEPDQGIPCDIDHFLPTKEHLDAREEQKDAEQIKRPVECFNERNPNTDHHTAQYQRTENTPKQHTMLVGSRHGEIGKNQYKNEDVIDTERIFLQVTGQKLQR